LVVFGTDIAVNRIHPISKDQAVNMLARNIGNRTPLNTQKSSRLQETNKFFCCGYRNPCSLPEGREVISLLENIQIGWVNRSH
jgi:hypothetical protein